MMGDLSPEIEPGAELTRCELLSVMGEVLTVRLLPDLLGITNGGVVEITVLDEDGNAGRAVFNAFAFCDLANTIAQRMIEADLSPPPI